MFLNAVTLANSYKAVLAKGFVNTFAASETR